MTCPACHRTITPADQRTRTERGDRDQPAYDEPGCKWCAPSDEDIDQAFTAHIERRFQEAREA